MKTLKELMKIYGRLPPDIQVAVLYELMTTGMGLAFITGILVGKFMSGVC
jgi:hypothetical protein